MKTIILKPYPNFHSARIKSPGLFLRVRVFRTTKEGIMFYGGPLKSDSKGSAILQAIRFPKDKFTVAQAKKWLGDHDHKYILFEPATKVVKAVWTGKHINDLPDSAFLYIEPGGEKDDEKKTKPRSLRHFPYKDKTGKIDLPHLRNAIARAPQSKLSRTVVDRVQAEGRKILEAQKKSLGKMLWERLME